MLFPTLGRRLSDNFFSRSSFRLSQCSIVRSRSFYVNMFGSLWPDNVCLTDGVLNNLYYLKKN